MAQPCKTRDSRQRFKTDTAVYVMKGKWRIETASSQDNSLWWKYQLVVMTKMMSITITIIMMTTKT